MKNNALLFALVLTLTAQTAFSQRKLSPGLRPYAENWTYTLVKAMHRAGFDMPSMAAVPEATNGVNARSVLQLDSTKTFFGFDSSATAEGTPLFRTVYQYPSANVKVETDDRFENGIWQKQSRATFVSDDQQRLVEVEAEVFNPAGQAFEPDSRLVIFPHGDSPELVDSFFTYLWDSTILDWHIILAHRNTFDAEDRLLETRSSLDYFGDPVIFEELYSYDANGDNNLIEEFAVLGDDVFPSSRTDLVYVDHRPIEVTVSVADSAGFVPQSRDNYAYTLFGSLRKHLSFEWDAEKGTWHLFRTIEYKYDDVQRLSAKETAFLPLDAPEEHELIHYAYLEGENLKEEWLLIWDEDLFDWVLDSKKHYYYNGLVSAPTAPGSVSTLRVSPNPTTGFVQIPIEDEAAIRVFDASGQLVQSRLVQPGQPMDLTLLPAGIYTVTALLGGDFYSGKIVKQ